MTSIKELVDLHSPITEKDLVIDVGGYQGDYAQAVFERFGCIVVEPNAEIYEALVKRFNDNPKIQCNPMAIGGESGLEKLYLREDGSSFFQEWAGTNEWRGVAVGRLSDFVKFAKIIPKIVKLNCEGAEYDIIKELDESGCLPQINELLVQLHKIPNWFTLRLKAEERLSKTHVKTYDYKWQLWKRKEINQVIGTISGQNTAGELIPQMS